MITMKIFILYALYDVDQIILKELDIVKCGEIMCHMYIYVLYSMMTALKIKQIIIIIIIIISDVSSLRYVCIQTTCVTVSNSARNKTMSCCVTLSVRPSVTARDWPSFVVQLLTSPTIQIFATSMAVTQKYN